LDGSDTAPSRSAMSTFSGSPEFYDLGANVGYFTLVGSALVGERGRVVAYEPSPKNTAAITVFQRAPAARSAASGHPRMATWGGNSAAPGRRRPGPPGPSRLWS